MQEAGLVGGKSVCMSVNVCVCGLGSTRARSVRACLYYRLRMTEAYIEEHSGPLRPTSPLEKPCILTSTHRPPLFNSC